jgi:transcriptional regulator with XRE-family HTH domain
MAEQKPTGRQIAAARALLGMTQPELATKSNISVPTLKRMEATDGPAAGMLNNIAAVRAALESAGVIFVEENGEGPGVRLKKRPQTAADLTDQIDTLKADMTPEPGDEKPSPKRGMKLLKRAYDQNELAGLKKRRAKVSKEEKK